MTVSRKNLTEDNRNLLRMIFRKCQWVIFIEDVREFNDRNYFLDWMPQDIWSWMPQDIYYFL